MQRNFLFLIVFMLFTWSGVNSQINPLVTKDSIAQVKWVDSVMSTMNLEEKIGLVKQLDGPKKVPGGACNIL